MLTFLFTDIERSTQLWEEHGRAMGDALSLHDAILHACVKEHGGQFVKHTGDGIFATFEGGQPLACAVAMQRRLAAADWGSVGEISVRIALHRGEAEFRDGDYFGSAVNQAARLVTAAWGGQIVLSAEMAEAFDRPEDAILEDYGVHMLKDLGHPQRIYGLLPAGVDRQGFPPLRTLSTRAHNLPPQPTPFIDRKEELTEIVARLEDPACRLLTLVGAGGIGKTRLALQVAAEIVDAFANGVFQVPLAPLSSTELIYPAIGDALRFPFSGPEESRVQLLNYLRQKEMLLVLDNFEHLIEGATIVANILKQTTRVKIVVTSRERLNLRGEWVFELPGMAVPNGERANGIGQYSAVQLFVQSAKRVHPTFRLDEEAREIVAHIVRLVEGIPLGIELAAAWVRALTPAEIAQEIERSRDFLATSSLDVPRRHQSLRAVFANSWNLLTGEERDVVRRLAIFRGSFGREAAQKVADASLSSLLALTDKSLIRRTASDRYEMLETLRRYAEEQLDEVPEAKRETRDRHSAYYMSLLQRHEEDLRGGRQKEALASLEADNENVREAWCHAVQAGRQEDVARGLRSLFHFYEIRGRLQEGLELFEQALDLFSRETLSPEREHLRGTLLLRRGWFSYRLGRLEEAQHDIEESLALFRRVDVPGERAFALYNLGILTYQLGRYDEAQAYLEESLAIWRELDDLFSVARSLSILGIVARDQGQFEDAERLLEESLAAHRQVQEFRGISRCLNLLALLRRDKGDDESAQAMLEESLTICRELEDRKGIAFSLSLLGVILTEREAYGQAWELVEESLAIREEIGDRRGTAFSLNDLGNIATGQAQYAAAAVYFRRALGTAREIGALPLALYVLAGVAALRAKEGDAEGALTLAQLVLNHDSSFEMANDKAERVAQEARAVLGPEAQARSAAAADPERLEAVLNELTAAEESVRKGDRPV